MFYFCLFLSLFLVKTTIGSSGDSSFVFQRCLNNCNLQNCTVNGDFLNPNDQPIYNRLLQWSCDDECNYNCMWKSVEVYEAKGKRVPQFYGKWPFIRLLGIQEPASVLFSLMNFYAHLVGIQKFRKSVREDSPMYFVWHAFCLISLNAWIWSTVFHTRDLPWTEFQDYASAFSIVLCATYCMILRMLKDVPGTPRFLKIILTVFFIAFFYDHIRYLKEGRFDYKYNMQVNILLGSVTLFVWFLWALYNRKRQPYVWKIALFVVLGGVTILLEIIDRPPVFYIVDCHALWHLTSVPLTYLFYSFLIDDCKFLRKQADYQRKIAENDVEKIKGQ